MPNWKKIKQLSFDEVRVRATQKLSAIAEQLPVLSPGRLSSRESILRSFVGKSGALSEDGFANYFRHERTSTFFPGFTHKELTVEALKGRFDHTALIRKADDIVRGRFDLLGLKQLDFGDPPDWSLEPRSGKKTPLIHWSRLDYLDAEVAGDKKIVWELNRHQYFMTLGRAYWVTGNEEYATTFVKHVESWMDQNPPKLGINWASSLEVSFRAISWIWALHFFKESEALTSVVLLRMLQYLDVHGRHLETYLSTYFSPNTHLTGEALGLLYLGVALHELPNASRWKKLGAKILLEQLPIHVRPDGVYFEQASYYHRYTADFYLHFLLLAGPRELSDPGLLDSELGTQRREQSQRSIFSDRSGRSAPRSDNKLSRLIDHLMYITRPDGLTPLFGDDDGGRLAMLSENVPNDFRPTLSTAAAVFKRGDYKFIAGELNEETLWLIGPSGCDSFDSVQAEKPELDSARFSDGGYYVMRDGWSDDSNYLLFDCGPLGQANCGHAHADALSFELAAKGESLLLDPGTYTYTGSSDERDWFRSSVAHNTLMINGLSSSEGSGPFSWKTIARCQLLDWISDFRFDFVSGKHDGYSRLESPVSHTRSILFLKGDYWIVVDELLAEASCEVSLRFHPPAHASTSFEQGNATILGKKSGLSIHPMGVSGQWKQEEGWVSDCYAKREAASVLVYTAQIQPGKSTLATLLMPNSVSETEVKQVEAEGGVAFEIKADSRKDIVLIRTRDSVKAVTLESDFGVTWVRVVGTTQAPSEVVAINGTSINFQGRPVLYLRESARYFHGQL